MEEEKEEKVEVTKEEIKTNVTNKKNNGIIIALIVFILLLFLALLYVLIFTKDEEVNPTPSPSPTITATPQATSEPEDIVEPTGKYDLVVYKYKSSGELTTEAKKDDYLTEAFKIKVNNKKAKVLATNYYSDNLLLLNDDGLLIYNAKTKKSEKINLENTYKEYAIYFNESIDKIIGIGYLDKNNKFGYYSITNNKKIFNGKYEVENLWEVSQINDHYLSLITANMVYLLSLDSEAPKLSYKDENGNYEYVSFGTNGNYIFALASFFESTSYERFYNTNYKMIYEVPNNSWISSKMIDYKDNYLYFVVDNVLYKHNMKGELVSTNSNYQEIELLDNGYIVYIKDSNLILENILDSSESKVLTKWNKDWYVETYESGYYTRLSLDRLGEKNKKEGLYVVIEYGYNDDGDTNKDSKGYYGIEYCYTKDKEVVTYPVKELMGGRAKPVLYLYPTKETNVTVKFEKPELLTTTYPKYINSWNVVAKPNGDLIDKDGKYYYALYWDEKRYNEVDFHEGFYVEGKNAISFLEEKLSYIGLNDKERNEFIMYWLPIMEKNGKNLVYFELTKERELGNKLIIEPKPDSLLRVSIHIKKVNTKVNIKEEKLEKFTRVGFTAVEWGGMTY